MKSSIKLNSDSSEWKGTGVQNMHSKALFGRTLEYGMVKMED
jgi:hypothetical protein